MAMTERWKYQIRIYLADEFAELARRDADAPAIAPLADVLQRHDAALKCQFDAFADYVAEAERQGIEAYPLYQWTKDTIEDPAKKAKYLTCINAKINVFYSFQFIEILTQTFGNNYRSYL